MFKKMVSFLGILIFSIVSCNAIQIELLREDFSYIVDTNNKTAKIRKIYIPAHTKKDIVVPKYIDYLGTRYVVNEIQENALKEVANQIKTFKVLGFVKIS